MWSNGNTPMATPDIPRFLECVDPLSGDETVYVTHTQFPRIMAKLQDDDSTLIWVKGWGDDIPVDYPAAKLMREMGDWYFDVIARDAKDL